MQRPSSLGECGGGLLSLSMKAKRMNEFEPALMRGLESSQNPEAKRLKRWLERNPKGPMRKRAMKQMQAQVDAASGARNYNAIDWEELFAKIGPFIKLLLALFA